MSGSPTRPQEARGAVFTADEVRAVLAGTKTQLRVSVKPQPSEGWQPQRMTEIHKMVNGAFPFRNGGPIVIGWGVVNADGDEGYVCPFGRVGDRLWVKERWIEGFDAGDGTYSVLRPGTMREPHGKAFYFAESTDPPDGPQRRWRPAITMPRWASRFTLEITDVRVERVQDISLADCYAEGVRNPVYRPGSVGSDYSVLNVMFPEAWDDRHGKGAWIANPWVWVVSFDVAKGASVQ